MTTWFGHMTHSLSGPTGQATNIVPRGARVRRLLCAALAITALASSAAACGGSGGSTQHHHHAAAGQQQKHSISLSPAYRPADVTLTGSDGKPFHVLSRLHGTYTLLFFGYTHCTDICPTTMADIAQTMRNLPAKKRSAIQVVFVTADPRRDSPHVLRDYLDRFDRHFVGVTGRLGVIKKLASTMHAAADPPAHPKKKNYEVSHSSAVYLTSPDAKAHLLFTAQTSPKSMTRTLRHTVRDTS